jgi:diacylglycerol kinase (ATP)
VRRALIITNPSAASAGAGALEAARARLESHGLEVVVETSRVLGDGERLARAAVADGLDVVIAHGGDGTVNDVVAGLAGTGRPLGLLPGGTGNVLAGNLGVRRSPVAAADTILAGATRVIDLGRLTTPAGTWHFAVNAAAGFAADLMAATAPRHKRRFGVAAYVAKAILIAADLEPVASRVEVDGVVHEGRACTIIVANCSEIVPGLLRLGEGIAPDDGLLDVAVLDVASYAEAFRLLWRRLRRPPRADPAISFHRGRTVRITTEPALRAQADGEPTGTTPMTVELLPRALIVFVPAPRGAAGGADVR